MFNDLALLVHEQVQMLNNIEHNITAAKNYTKKSEENLARAKESYLSSRTVCK